MMKNILLAVVGLSPQVITETLYALHQLDREVNAIHVITTRKGKEQINAHLLSHKDGKYYAYLGEYGIDPKSIDFGYDNVHTVRDDRDIEIDDISSEEENEWLLKKCLELTFRFTSQPDTSVFFSVAGGRKTMSACLVLAAQMYGRPRDRAYHVLVSPEFESNRDFYYPSKISVSIELKNERGEPYFKETRFARITLVPIPFFSIRENLSGRMLKGPKDPATLMMSLVKEEAVRLEIDLVNRKVIFKGKEHDMMPAWLALLAFFAQQKKNCTLDLKSCRNCTACYLDFQGIEDRQNEITDLYRRIAGGRHPAEMSDSGIVNLNVENFNSYKTKIRKDLARGFGLYSLEEISIISTGKKPDTKYGIRLDRDRIRIIL